MLKIPISIYDMQTVIWALETIHAYHADNSCGDPDCCTPMYDESHLATAEDDLRRLGIELEIDFMEPRQ